MLASKTSRLYHIWETVILFYVSVPVLSEHMQEVDPRVSTDSRFFTKTIFFAMRLAVRARASDTIAGSPSGTFAISIPMAKITFVKMLYLKSPLMKKIAPIISAMIDIISMNLDISLANGVCLVLVELDSSAIRPITVSSPIRITMPLPRPSEHIVPNKATFSVSRMF